MLFKDLKSGYSVYLFDRGTVKLVKSKVIDVTPPHFDSHYGNTTDMVVDVMLEGHNKPYTFKERTETGYVNDTVISTNLDVVMKEVESVMMQSEQGLSQQDTYKSNIEKCKKILSEYSPSFKQKQETDERMNSMEKTISEMKEMMKSQQEMFSKFMKELNGK